MSYKNGTEIHQSTIWEGTLDTNPTWLFYKTEIERAYMMLHDYRLRLEVDYELIKRSAWVAYANFMTESARTFLFQTCSLTSDQARNMVFEIYKDIGRMEVVVRDNHEAE